MKTQTNRSVPPSMETLEARQMMTATVSNNTFEKATFVSDFYLDHNHVTSDRLDAAGPNGFYKFTTLYGKSQFNATLYGLSKDTDLFLYDGNRKLIAQSSLSGNQSETINANLDARTTYYIQVKRYGGDTGFTLNLQNDYSGSTLPTARDVGASWGQGNEKFWNIGQPSYYDYLNYRDNVDVVKFKMEANGTVVLNRTLSQKNSLLVATMQLLDETGKVVPVSYLTTPNGTITSDEVKLNAGTYYVKFTQVSGAGDYQFRIVSDYAGSDTASARDLGDVTNVARQMFDMVGNSGGASYEDQLDLYKFKVNKQGQLDVRVLSQIKTKDLYGGIASDFNKDGRIDQNEIFVPFGGNLGERTFNGLLNTGTYYIVVKASAANQSYQLDLDSDFDADPKDAEPYNNLKKAIDLGNVNGERNLKGGFGISAGDFADFYKFKMTADGQVSARALNNSYWSRSNIEPTVTIARDTNGNGRIEFGEQIVTAVSKLTTSLKAGTYYVRLNGVGPVSEYDLRLVTNFAGNTLGTARNIGVITGKTPVTKVFSDYIEQDFGAGNNTNDYYKFSLGSRYRTTFSTKGVSGQDLSLALIRDANGNGKLDAGDTLATSDVANSPTEAISQRLNAGTYFVRVLGLNGWTNYDLTGSFTAA